MGFSNLHVVAYTTALVLGDALGRWILTELHRPWHDALAYQ
jgi:hypothetical protein